MPANGAECVSVVVWTGLPLEPAPSPHISQPQRFSIRSQNSAPQQMFAVLR